MINIPKNPRKLKRYLENEYYAQDASFWLGVAKTADRSEGGFLRPINRMAARGTIFKKKNRKKDRRPITIYAVRFEDLSGKAPTFIKIGVTSSSIEIRFSADVRRYKAVTIKDRVVYGWPQALVLESALHKLLSDSRSRPEKVLLSGGNSECFVYSQELERQICNLLT